MHNEADSLEEKSMRQIKHKATEPRSKEQKEKTRDSGLKCRLHFRTRRGQGILHGPRGRKGHRSKTFPEEVLTLTGADRTSTGRCCRGRRQLAHGAAGWFSAEGQEVPQAGHCAREVSAYPRNTEDTEDDASGSSLVDTGCAANPEFKELWG